MAIGDGEGGGAPRPLHHDPDGRFRNPWPGGQLHGFAGLLRWWTDRLRNRPPPDPDAAVFARVAPSFHAPRAAADHLTLTWIGHSTVLAQVGRLNLLTDPHFGARASPVRFAGPMRWVAPGVALDDLPPLDLVLLSHNHYDHLDAGSVRAIAARWPLAPWVVPLRLGAALRELGVSNTVELDWWDRHAVDGLEITAVPAQHFSGRSAFDRNRTLWCGFAVRGPFHRLYFAGDTGFHPEFGDIGARLGPFDAALLPVGAYEPRWFMRPVHMNPEEAVAAFLALGSATTRTGTMVPIHWGTFKLTDEPMDEPPARTRAACREAGLAAHGLWVPRHGETLHISGARASRAPPHSPRS